MCPYMIYFKGEKPVCEPKNNLCTLCILGNKKIFNEIETDKKEMNKWANGN